MASDSNVVPLSSAARAFQEVMDCDGVVRNDKGAVIACEQTALALLRLSDLAKGVHYDTFYGRLRNGERDFTDGDEARITCNLQELHKLPKLTRTHVRGALLVLAEEKRSDWLMNYVMGLTWDGKPRIETALIEAFGALDTELTRATSKNFFVALAARACDPGCQVDFMIVFEGPQGAGKSSALRALGADLHVELTAAIGTPDFYRQLRGVWIAELSELESLKGREATAVKMVISCCEDIWVEKYQAHASRYKRRCVLVATTNETEYWHDATGARRLIPVKVGDIDVGLIREHREQWFAEAVFRYMNNDQWWLFPDEVAAEQEDRQAVDPWENSLRELIERGRMTRIGGQDVLEYWPDGWVASAEITEKWLALPTHLQGAASGVRLGKIMKRLGFKSAKGGPHRARGWIEDTQDGTD